VNPTPTAPPVNTDGEGRVDVGVVTFVVDVRSGRCEEDDEEDNAGKLEAVEVVPRITLENASALVTVTDVGAGTVVCSTIVETLVVASTKVTAPHTPLHVLPTGQQQSSPLSSRKQAFPGEQPPCCFWQQVQVVGMQRTSEPQGLRLTCSTQGT